ncbi:MAG: hypothetical protein E6J50_02435 [Chloroflexi bacterium]|nr:MAG: hypothetical protein E6J50_02435 [Chloroflexota bacterium]
MKIALPSDAMVVLVGIAGSGKSTFARAHFAPTEILSSDAFRAVVADDEADQSASGDAFALLHAALALRLRRARLAVVDATNVEGGRAWPSCWISPSASASRGSRAAASIRSHLMPCGASSGTCVARWRACWTRDSRRSTRSARRRWQRQSRSNASRRRTPRTTKCPEGTTPDATMRDHRIDTGTLDAIS